MQNVYYILDVHSKCLCTSRILKKLCLLILEKKEITLRFWGNGKTFEKKCMWLHWVYLHVFFLNGRGIWGLFHSRFLLIFHYSLTVPYFLPIYIYIVKKIQKGPLSWRETHTAKLSIFILASDFIGEAVHTTLHTTAMCSLAKTVACS